jgi:ubiquinone/menaquinone biosynthesis C-methylase UbiE
LEYQNSGASRDAFYEPGISCGPTRPTSLHTPPVAPPIPDYLRKTYSWAYLDERGVRWLDRDSVVQAILWQQHRRLERAAFAEILPGQNVLQAACVYGSFSAALAQHVGNAGKLQIVDVADVQVKNCRRKLSPFAHVLVRHENVLHLRDTDIDVACCYFLMHELPEDYKRGVVAALLRSVRPGGRVLFVDYHKPHWAHPLKPVTSVIFDTLEPYAKGLWNNEIAAYGGELADYAWSKETFFGGLFQKVVATRKETVA